MLTKIDTNSSARVTLVVLGSRQASIHMPHDSAHVINDIGDLIEASGWNFYFFIFHFILHECVCDSFRWIKCNMKNRIIVYYSQETFTQTKSKSQILIPWVKAVTWIVEELEALWVGEPQLGKRFAQVSVVLRDPARNDLDLLLPHILKPLGIFASRVSQVNMVSPCHRWLTKVKNNYLYVLENQFHHLYLMMRLYVLWTA